jgi:hypothetical protein
VAPSAAADAIAETAPVADSVPLADTAAQANPAAPPVDARADDAAQAPTYLDLFRTDGRQGVSSLVSELWGPRASADPTPSTTVAPVANTDAAPTADPRVAPRRVFPPLDIFGTGHPQRPSVDRNS